MVPGHDCRRSCCPFVSMRALASLQQQRLDAESHRDKSSIVNDLHCRRARHFSSTILLVCLRIACSAITAPQRPIKDECSADFGTYGELFLITSTSNLASNTNLPQDSSLKAPAMHHNIASGYLPTFHSRHPCILAAAPINIARPLQHNDTNS